MGYCVEISEKTFNFDSLKSENIIKKIKETFKDYDDETLRWVDKKDILNSETIEEMFDVFRLEIYLDEDVNLYKIDYMSGEKYGGYEKDLYICIAEFINDSYIEYLGEDGDKWRYIFKDGQCKEVYPTVSWE